jgi:hypothetical protein
MDEHRYIYENILKIIIKTADGIDLRFNYHCKCSGNPTNSLFLFLLVLNLLLKVCISIPLADI